MKDYSKYLKNKSPEVEILLKKLFTVLDEITGGDYEVEEKQDSLHIVKNKAFLGVHFLKDVLRLNIVLDREIKTDLPHKLDKPSANVFHNKVDLGSVEDLSPEIIQYLRNAYSRVLKKHNSQIEHQDFVQQLKKQFPTLVDELNDPIWKGLLHLEMSAFARYTQQKINEMDHDESKRCFIFIDEVGNNCSDEILNAIGVSFFEHIDLEGDNKWVYKELLSEEQKRVYNNTHGKS